MAKQKDTQAEAAETTRKTVRWTGEMRQFVLERPTLGRTELVAEFRAAYPDFPGSDQAVVGQRYRLLHGKNTKPETRRAGLEARIRAAREELAALEAELETLDANQAGPTADELAKMDMAALRSLVKERGVTPDGRKKVDFIAALTA